MSIKGKNINLFLLDGVPKGRKKCTIANWIGVAYQIPRTHIDECTSRPELKQSGVYFLFGKSEETDEKYVYVGQAGTRNTGKGILDRLKEHRSDPEKDYWTEAVIFITSNNTFGPTEISYLEHHFCVMATEAKRYTVKNGNTPTPGNVTEEKESELVEFIEYSKLVMGVLGHMVLEPYYKTNINTDENADATSKNDTIFYIKADYKDRDTNARKIADAKGMRINDGFIVMKDSIIVNTIVATCPNSARKAREKYAADIDENWKLTKDIPFNSPSGAAGFVLGSSASGNKTWRTIDGIPLGLYENQETIEKNDSNQS